MFSFKNKKKSFLAADFCSKNLVTAPKISKNIVLHKVLPNPWGLQPPQTAGSYAYASQMFRLEYCK